MRDLRVMPSPGAAYPVTGLSPSDRPDTSLTWTPEGVSLGQISYRGIQPVTFGAAPSRLVRAGRT